MTNAPESHVNAELVPGSDHSACAYCDGARLAVAAGYKVSSNWGVAVADTMVITPCELAVVVTEISAEPESVAVGLTTYSQSVSDVMS